MNVQVHGPGPAEPFLGARDLFETERDIERPVTINIVADPDERTRVSHTDEGHRLTISRQAATSAMARELALHEYAHMLHNEFNHPSHTQSTEEAIFLALAGRTVEQRKLTHCHQIANHMKDIYADDVWLAVAPGDKLVAFLESSLAAALADHSRSSLTWPQPAGSVDPTEGGSGVTDESGVSTARRRPGADPEITAVNAAFALGLVERHGLVEEDHRLYDLAHAAAADAPGVEFESFRRLFRSLSADPDTSEYRKVLVEATRTYAGDSGQAAD
ncbi:MAG: hypothetical protein J07HX64_00958 [halophilic archaeon J07HX64]|jgi:hypothetical protein|nr:MAG: hypothetical protein J07HX64_00958 [halophilic archaeon J07HX64]